MVPVGLFDVKRCANPALAEPLATKTNCYERKMLFAWL